MHFDIGLISANNGWAMALTGAIIVMCGLSLLSLIISQLHKVITLFEAKPTPASEVSEPAPAKRGTGDIDFLNDLEGTAKLYKVISEDLGATFELTKLYQITQRDQLPHPHVTIRNLRQAGYLMPVGEGRFSWKNC